MKILPEQTWPLREAAWDPYAGDELLGDEAPCDEAQAAFLALCRQALQGGLSPADPRLRAAAHRAGLLSAPPGPIDRSPPLVAERLPSEQWFSDLAEDQVPEIGLLAPERVLGPYADERPDPGALLVAAGVMAFSAFRPPKVRPADRWYADRRGAPPQDRAAVRAADRAPPLLWRARPRGWQPLLPLPRRLRPRGPVRLLPLRDGAESRPAGRGCWVARVFPGPGGSWYAALALPLPVEIDPAPLRARLVLELWRARCSAPGLSWTELLRQRGEVVYRSCCERAWLAQEDLRCTAP